MTIILNYIEFKLVLMDRQYEYVWKCTSAAFSDDDEIGQILANKAEAKFLAIIASKLVITLSRWEWSILSFWVKQHTRLTTLFPGLPRWAGTRKVKPVWILLKQETVSGSDVSWAIWKSAPCSRQPHQHPTTFSHRPDALPAAQPTGSKHWRQVNQMSV